MKKDPMAIAGLVVLVLFFALFSPMGCNHARAATLTTTTYTATLGRGYDAGWECDSMWLVYQPYPSADSVYRIKMTKNAVVDTHSYFANIPLSSYHAGYQMNVWGLAWITTLPYPITVDVQNSGMNNISIDSARVAGSATVVLDSAQLAYIASLLNCDACAGTGLNLVRLIALDTTNDMRVPYVDLQVFLMDQVTSRGHAPTNATGYFDFSLSDGTYLVRAGTPSVYATETANDTITVSGATQDTIELYALTIAVPPVPGLTAVTFNFYNGKGEPIQNAILTYSLDAAGAPYAYHLSDSTQIFDPASIYPKRTNAFGQVTIYVVPNDSILIPAGQVGKTRWLIKALAPDGVTPLLGVNGVKLDVPANVSGLVYPKDF